jgi:uncharacterized protein (TIGR02145 family)
MMGAIIVFIIGIPVSTADAGRIINDARDGNTYGVIRIGSQLWLNKNALYHLPDSWCPGGTEANCQMLGRLYTWPSALQACPAGTHLPSDAELKTLENTVQGDSAFLKSPKNGGISGARALGFNAQPGGFREPDGTYHNLEQEATLWSATEKNKDNAFKRWILMDGRSIQRIDRPKATGYQVRCIVN